VKQEDARLGDSPRHTIQPLNHKVKNPPLHIGLFGIGHDAYWPQFPGLKERLEGYLGVVAEKLARPESRS